MSKDIAQSISKNTTVMMGGQIVTWISSFVLMLFLPRYLGSTEYGRLFLVMSISSITQVFIEFGGYFYITKLVARDPERTPYIFMNSAALRFVLWICSLAFTVGFISFAGYPSSVNMLLVIFALSKAWEEVTNLLQRCFQGREMMRYATLGNISERVFLMIIGVAALLRGASVVTIGIIMSAATLLNFLVSIRFMPKFISFFPKIEFDEIKTIVRQSVPYFLWSIFGMIYYRVDAVMLSFMTPEKVVGWYGAAYRFFDILMFLPSIFTTAVFPVFSRLWNKESASLTWTTQKSLDFIILAAIPIGVGGALFADKIVWLFYGAKEFGPTIGILKIFFVGIPLVYINFIFLSLIVAADKQRGSSMIAFFAMLLNPLLNWFLIPYFQSNHGNGGVGAAIATLITEYFMTISAFLIMPKGILGKSLVRTTLRAVGAGSIMAGSLMALNQTGVPWFVNIVIGICIYVVVIFSIRTFSTAEMAFMRNFLSYRNLKNVFRLKGGTVE
jgi:O-antigen/teichoic acid export membrane protein